MQIIFPALSEPSSPHPLPGSPCISRPTCSLFLERQLGRVSFQIRVPRFNSSLHYLLLCDFVPYSNFSVCVSQIPHLKNGHNHV